ncbi:MAG: hypothetical protein ACREN5_10400 [Gemmatimonadales bacterium]
MNRVPYRFALWHLVDLARARGLAMAIMGGLFAWIAALNIPPQLPDVPASMALTALLRQMLLFFSLIATGNLIYADRHQGYFRLIFSKPVNPVGYYLQAFFLAAVVVAAGLLITWGAFALLERPVAPRLPVWWAAAVFLYLGSVTYLFSFFTRLDWLAGWMLFGLSAPLRMVYARDESVAGAVLHYLLPPTHLLDAATRSTGDWIWLFGYPTLAFVGSLLLVRLRPLGGAA